MKTNSGYTLIEVMLSVIVLALLALGGAAMLRHAGGSIKYQQQYRAALAAATSRLEYNVYERGVEQMKALADASGGAWENTTTVDFDRGGSFVVREEILYNGNVEVRVRASGRATEDVTLCYIASPEG